jgi:hypothetical protein
VDDNFDLKKALEIEDLTAKVENWIRLAPGEFSVADLDRDFGFKDPIERANRTAALERLVELNALERFGTKRGWYRSPEKNLKEMDFISADDRAVDLKLPFRLSTLVEVMPGNIITLAGEKNSGKTALMLDIAKENRETWNVHYFNSEMEAGELKKRLLKFDIGIDQWGPRFHAYRRDSDFGDVIFPGKQHLNLIDFLECHDEFYKMGGYIKDIHRRLEGGIAVIAIQKNPNQEDPIGGRRSTEKSRLHLALSNGKLRIVVGKNWASETNPNGLAIRFKLVQGWKFIPDVHGGWMKDGN